MTARTLSTPDGDLPVLHDMGGEGPPVILTHGNGLNAGMWATVVPHLDDRLHCYGLDFRGHGGSRPPSDDFPVERPRLAHDILAAVEAVGGPPVVAAGHSLGGATLLLTEMWYPGTFSALWVFEPVLIPETFERPPGDMALAVMARKRRMEFDSVDEVFERFTSKPPFAGCEPEAVRGYVEIGTYELPGGGVRLSCSGETEARIYGGATTDFDLLKAVACPVVVAYGGTIAGDNDMPPSLAPMIVDALGDARLERFDGLTHFGPMEDGATIAASVAAHLRP
jgi:pimeloyl-ACP methyl ester carboxylesterase